MTALSMLPSTIGTWTKVSLNEKEEEGGREGRNEGVTALLSQGERGKEGGEGSGKG